MKLITSIFCFIFLSNLNAQKLDYSVTLNDEKIKITGIQTGELDLISPSGSIERYGYEIVDGYFTTYELKFVKNKIVTVYKKSVPVKDLDLAAASIGDTGDGFKFLTILNLDYVMTAEHITWSKEADKSSLKSYNISCRVKTEEGAKKIIEELKEAQK